MQELQKKGWITRRNLKKKGKGRPVHIYSLSNPIDDIIKSFEEEKIQEINEIKQDLNDLKKILSGY